MLRYLIECVNCTRTVPRLPEASHVARRQPTGPLYAGSAFKTDPEAALSFTSCLRLVALMHDLGRRGAQVICATHSPILAATPDAAILELGDHGIRATTWEDLDLVDHHRRYLADPHTYLRRVLDAEDRS
jgi:hypothetical protein